MNVTQKKSTGLKHTLVLSVESWTCIVNGLMITQELTEISSFVMIEGDHGL